MAEDALASCLDHRLRRVDCLANIGRLGILPEAPAGLRDHKDDMSADIDGSPHLDEHIASDSLFSPVHALKAQQEVPDSDNDESLEQLAERQEQEYWSMLGVEDEPVAYTSSPRSAVSTGRCLIF